MCYIFLSRKPLARAIGSLGSGLGGTGFCGAAKNKISSFSILLSPLLSLSLFRSSFLSPFFRLSPPLRSLILSVRVPLGTLRLGRSEESSGALDRSLVDPDNHRPVAKSPEHRVLEARILPSFLSRLPCSSLTVFSPMRRKTRRDFLSTSSPDWDRRRTCLPICRSWRSRVVR